MAKPLPISVCVIAGAEAGRLSRALESVAGWTSEIVVVLNEEVTDGTDRIATGCGAQVFREPWKGHVAQKNSAAAKARQPWLLSLDADEAVSPALRAEISALFADPPRLERCTAFSMPRRNRYCGRWIRHGDWYPDRKTRLWRRGAAAWVGVDPHDRLQTQGTVGRLQADLLHYSMETLNHQVAKTVRYADDFVHRCAAEQRPASLLDLAVRPPWRFLRSYVFKLGFLDGWQGFAIAWMTAFYTFLRYAKVLEARQPGPPPA